MSWLACPDCHRALDGSRCPACGRAFVEEAGVLALRSRAAQANAAERHYLDLYQRTADPWAYEHLAVERLKAERVMALVDRLAPQGSLVVEAGCATGHITRRLVTRPVSAVVFDLVPQAVATTRALVPAPTAAVEYVAASATELPLADGTVDLLLLLDGPMSWKLDEAQLGQLFAEALRVVKPGGRVLVMDYLSPSKFPRLREAVVRSPLRLVAEHPFPDRLSYVLESMVRALKGLGVVRWFFSSLPVGRALAALSRPFGHRGSKHVVLECERPSLASQ
ncbi:MAG: class I SAM-dependent methyltransferase [Myxococcaceae bacterium]|nr:class I SAM-dependent methyltransferase [Myxococcaceae bacterium]